MIEASVAAVPGLIVSFLAIATFVAVPTALVAKVRRKPWALSTALAIYLSGIAAVTLLPGDAGLNSGQCDTGMPTHVFTSASSLLNVAFFVPGAFLAVLLFKRPITVAAAFACLSGGIELVQSLAYLGRSCSVTDMAANTIGAVLGALIGALYLRWSRQPMQRLMRDTLWAVAVAGGGAALFVGIFQTQIESVDVVAMDDQQQSLAESSVEATEWITAASKDVFGSDTQMRQMSTKRVGGQLQVNAETNRGSISGLWPDKNLVSAWSSNMRGDEGSLTKAQVAKVARRFAQEWFPENVAGSEQEIRTMGEGPTRAYLVTYRRYAQGAMMPMRLDLTVTSAGRLIGFTARTVADPAIPAITVDEADARDLAEKETGKPTDDALLLVQKVKNDWRPVWLVGSGGEDIAIDAASGDRIPGGTQP